jgi:hypothetical protein
MTSGSDDPLRTLAWAHGSFELQRLGAMLAPVVFRAPDRPDFAPMQVAPWADEPGHEALPGLMQRLRGEWPCVPFGSTARRSDLPAGWQTRQASDGWSHGFASNHTWQWLASPDALTLALAITVPDGMRLTREVRADAAAPALDMTLRIEVAQACTLPVALHPTLRLDAGRVALDLPHTGEGLTYPVDAEPGISRLAANRRFADLHAVPRSDGSSADLTQFPQAVDSEELLLLQAVNGPVALHYLDQGWSVAFDWDRSLLPDVMLWVSQRGRRHAPWNGRHLALGVEPLNGAFDLGRVATPPTDHPLANRGIHLVPGRPCVIRYRMHATPSP